MTDINSADSSQGTPVLSSEVARQIREVTDPLSKMELLCGFTRVLRKSSFGRSKETSGLTQGSLRALNTMSETWRVKTNHLSWFIADKKVISENCLD